MGVPHKRRSTGGWVNPLRGQAGAIPGWGRHRMGHWTYCGHPDGRLHRLNARPRRLDVGPEKSGTCSKRRPRRDYVYPDFGARPQHVKSGLQRPDVSPHCPDVSLQWPDVGLQWPDVSLQWPDVGLQWPDVGLQWPDVSLQWPDVGLQWPDVSLQWPDVSLHWPDVNRKKVCSAAILRP